MAAFLRWIEQNNQVPWRKLRDRIEFYDAAEFLSGYLFSKETVMEPNRKIGPTESSLKLTVSPFHLCLLGADSTQSYFLFIYFNLGKKASPYSLNSI